LSRTSQFLILPLAAVVVSAGCSDTPVTPDLNPAFAHTTGPPGAPHLTLTKLTNGVDAKNPPGPMLVPGEAVTWTYIVENDGGSPFSLVEISDDREGFVCRLERNGPGGPILPVGESAQCELIGTVQPGPYANVGTASGTSSRGRPAMNTDASHYSANSPPVCTAAAPTVSEIWPANHKFVVVGVLGVVDPEGDATTVTIDAIYQDESTDTFGDGSFTPDGLGVGTSTAEVRAERAGSKKAPGDGRVYHINFTASDTFGGTCNGEVLVSVPHDRRGAAAVDGGPLFDSTN
jgi:hypothetical protein